MGYFGEVLQGVKTTFQGMKVTASHLGEPTFTIQYPEEQKPIPDSERGLHEYDVERCIACDNCAKACPVDCIYIEADGKGKAAKMLRFEIDYSKCLFCNLCVPPCPVDCIKMGKDFDHTGFSRGDMVIPFHKDVRRIKVHTETALKDIEDRKAAKAKAAAAAASPPPAPPAAPPTAAPPTA